MIKKMREGTLSEKEKSYIVETFNKIAIGIARKYTLRKNYDEYYAEALIGISNAIILAPQKMYDNEVEKWVKYCIIKQVRNYRVNDHLIRFPQGSRHHFLKKGKEYVPMMGHPLTVEKTECSKLHEVHELWEYLNKAAKTDFEKEVIELRAQNFTDQEVADILEVTRSKVLETRRMLERRFNRIMKEHEN